MEIKNLDIVQLIERNPITRLTKNYQNKFIEKIRKNFTESQQQLFVTSFYTYLNYSKDDFIIDLDSIWKWLGFERKGFCKKVLEKHFAIDIDYKIVLLQLEKRKNEGGFNKETILLKINTFKKLCLKSNTKKADEIHDYFIKMEDTFNEVVNEESNELRLQLSNKQQELSDKNYQLEKKQMELEKEKKSKNWLLNRRYNDSKPNDTIYLYKDYKNNDTVIDENIKYYRDEIGEYIYKVGKTKNIAERENEYSNMSKSGQIVYIQYCLNCDLTEKLLHHVLDKYRLVKNQEWFNFTEELGIQTIKTIIYIIDYNMETIDNFIPKLHDLLEIPIEIKLDKVERVKDNTLINPNNFDLFIDECCEITDETNTPKTCIKDAHRIWSKCNTKETISALDNYLGNKFKSTTIIDKEGVKRNMFKNIKLKPLIYTVSDKNLDYEQFIIDQVDKEQMKVNWKCRISYVDFFNYFIEWKRNEEPHYKLKHLYKKQIQAYLETIFAGGRVYISTDAKALHLHGIWGVGHISSKFGYKEPARTNKVVSQYTLDNILIKQWNSLSIASRELNIRISTLSNNARFKTVINGIYYKYEE